MADTTEIVGAMVRGYVEAAVWAGTDPDHDDDPLDERYGVEDITDEAMLAITDEVADFVESNLADLEHYAEVRHYHANEGTVWDYAGHDFYLTRNHAGTGFWDRGKDPVFDRLTKASDPYGEQLLYVGDDGRLYV